MNGFKRVWLTAAALVSTLVLVPTASASASAAGAEHASVTRAAVAKPSCTFGEITGSGDWSNEPSAHRPGQKADAFSTVHNAGAAPLSGLFFDYEVVSPNGRRGPEPTVWWRVIGGGWHLARLDWYPPSHGGEGYWESEDTALGVSLPGHTTRTMELSTSFAGGSPQGMYDGILGLSSSACGRQLLGDFSVLTGYTLPRG